MPKIKLTEKELSKRGPELNKLLGPLLRNPKEGGPAWSQKTGQGFQVAIIARDKVLTNNYESWRFATFHRDFKAVYYEIWLPLDIAKQDSWYLTKAYLNIFRIDRTKHDDKEYVCLHIDPEESEGENAKYKQSPHLHIKAADAPIPKAHIAIVNGFLEQILSSEKQLFKAMKLGIELIRVEILDRIPVRY